MANKSRYTTKLANFICSEIEKGFTISEICETLHKDITPASQTVYRWKKKKPDFARMLAEAYKTFIYKKMDELEQVSKTPLDKLYPELDSERARMEARRARLDALKYIIGTVAKHLNPVFDISQKLEVENSGSFQFQLAIWDNHIIDTANSDKKLDSKTH